MVDNDCKPYGSFHRELGLLVIQNKKDCFSHEKPFIYASGV